MDLRVGLSRKLSAKELMLLNCGVGEDSWESFGLLDCKEIQPVHPKGNQSWIFTGRTDAEAETPIFWPPDAKNWLIGKDPDAGKDWRQEEKETTEDGWMASVTQWTWVWVNSRSWWWTGRPGVLQFMGSQSRIRLSDWTELNWRAWGATVHGVMNSWTRLNTHMQVLGCWTLDKILRTAFGVWQVSCLCQMQQW